MAGYIGRRGKSWVVAVDLGRDADGKRRRVWKSVRGKRRDAEKVLTELLHRRDSGVDISPERLRVGDFLAKWLATHAKPNTAPKTYLRYEQLVRVHIVPAIGAILLAKLKPLHVQAVYSEMLAKNLSPRTVTQAHRVLRRALRDAVGWHLVVANVADAVKPPRFQRYEPQTVVPEQVQRLLAAADETAYGMLVRTAAWTGLRAGELAGLRWRDLDLAGAMLHVRQVCQWLPRQGFLFREPKTKRSARSVALTPRTVEYLRDHRRRQLEERMAAGAAYDKGPDLVFANAVGAPLHPSNTRDGWKRITKAADAPIRFHDLRHFHASELLRQGVNVKVVQERMGHASITVTMDLYSHLTPTMQRQAAENFDRLFADG